MCSLDGVRARSQNVANLRGCRPEPVARPGRPGRFLDPGAGNMAAMIAFFVILVVLMVLVAAAGQWSAAPRRRVVYRDAVVDRRPDLVEEEVVEDAYPVDTRSRRVVRRRRSY